jgi:hypothetical protein
VSGVLPFKLAKDVADDLLSPSDGLAEDLEICPELVVVDVDRLKQCTDPGGFGHGAVLQSERGFVEAFLQFVSSEATDDIESEREGDTVLEDFDDLVAGERSKCCESQWFVLANAEQHQSPDLFRCAWEIEPELVIGVAESPIAGRGALEVPDQVHGTLRGGDFLADPAEKPFLADERMERIEVVSQEFRQAPHADLAGDPLPTLEHVFEIAFALFDRSLRHSD